MSSSNPEHTQVRLPLLAKLLELGWDRARIICPSPDSDDKEWRVPKTPSEASKREAGRSFEGFPVDLAIFDSAENTGVWDHVTAIFECKAPNIETGISQLQIYLGLEPHARFGYWTNGTSSARVYKRADGGFLVEENAALPSPKESFIYAGEKPLTFCDLVTPTEAVLSGKFRRILGAIAANDSISTRPEQRLNEMANLIIVKLESDKIGSMRDGEPLDFQLQSSPLETARAVNSLYRDYKETRPELFLADDKNYISLGEESIQQAVFELQTINLKAVAPKALSTAFQVFRTANLKIGDGQYFTPQNVIEAGIEMLDITVRDRVIDPACGTGGFLDAAYEKILSSCEGDARKLADARTWAHDKLYGVDRDSINVKLTRALMVGVGDGSAHIYIGDSIRTQRWKKDFPRLFEAMAEGSYTVVVTNPPFGKDLRVSARDGRASDYSVCMHTPGGLPSASYSDTELGIVFVERAYRLLKSGGRLGIILPETYFFSKSYAWFREWLDERFELKGVLNVPMEAFQEFCRAKTNFYVFAKKGKRSPTTHAPGWFDDSRVWISNAPTIGINKDGLTLHCVDESGNRLPEIDNKAIEDVRALLSGGITETSCFVAPEKVEFIGVPKYSDHAKTHELRRLVEKELPGFKTTTIAELKRRGDISIRNGHGSPSADIRTGDIPYIKVSDLRAGLVNINSTNMIPRAAAEKFWKGRTSGLSAYDVITPSRACKNIGEPVVLMPDQTEIVLTKEVIVFSVNPSAKFDAFYLAWALDLRAVHVQWDRVIFMQTNREDVGNRYLEIELPDPPSEEAAANVSRHYREYYESLAKLKQAFLATKEVRQLG